ncbi:MAG: OB-fold domain-containing protein [Acidimicrobiales bacterium]
MARIPIVDHLVLEPEPHLVAQQCTACGARFFGRRNGCAACGATSFAPAEVPTEGTVTAFTIVTFAAPGIDVPFVAAIVDCDGTTVQANVINTPPDVDHVHLGMRVRLATTSLGADAAGDEGVGFGFEPIEAQEAAA